jgi:hypothetical protein
METTIFTLFEPKQLYRRMEAALDSIDTKEPPRRQAQKLCSALWTHLVNVLQLQSIQFFECWDDNPELICVEGKNLSDSKDKIAQICGLGKSGKVDLPCLIPGHNSIFVVIHTGISEKILMCFTVESTFEYRTGYFLSQIVSIFSALQYATAQHAIKLELQDALEQARAIQMSLLPSGEYRFCGFDLAARSIPAHKVGGDIYDYELFDSSLTVALADAAGHGLPAALQARDVVIGLRAARDCNQAPSKLVEKLNRLIYRSGLVSRFVSLFYGTLTPFGLFTYANAGHPPPLLSTGDSFLELLPTGMILGPHLESAYEERTVCIPAGESLFLFSDGVPEHSSTLHSEFGIERIKIWMTETRELSASAALDDLFERLRIFGYQKPFEDDVTAILVKHAPMKDNLQI